MLNIESKMVKDTEKECAQSAIESSTATERILDKQTVQTLTKWKFAIGTTSIVPNSDKHYYIADFDCPIPDSVFKTLQKNNVSFIVQKTKNGFHLYTDWKMSFNSLIKALRATPSVDRKWISIGIMRGYFFLADKDSVNMNWEVKRMVIYHGKKETQNTTRTRFPI